MEFLKTNSTIIKKDSSLNFKQALLKKFSKKTHKSPLDEKSKPLKTNAKKETKKNNEKLKKQIKPFLTKREIQMNNNNKKTSEKIKNLLKHVRNNNLKNNNPKNNFKNKSTSNLGTSQRSVVSKKTSKNFEENKSPKLNDFIFENNGMNHNINNINVVNVHNSTINICKNKVNIITSKSDENLNNIDVNDNSNFNINKKNSSISSVVRNNKKIYLYSSSQSPSYRFPYNKEIYNKDHYYLNNSNDNIESQNIYIKQKFNCPINNKNNFHIKTNTQKDFFKFEQNKSQNTISEKCLQNLLKTEPNKFNNINKFYTRNNINKMTPIEKLNVYELDYINNENNKNATNTSKYNNNVSHHKNFFTTNHYFYNLNHKRNSANEINNISSPKIYVKPSNYPFSKNNISEKILNLSPSKFPLHDPPSPIRNFYFSNAENKTPKISSYRNNENYNKRKSNYFHNIEFKSSTNTNEKVNKNARLYDIQKSKTKAYIKKNKDIKFNKRDSTKLSLIKNKVSNNENSKLTKYYNYYISRQLIIKRPFYCSKYIKKPKILPVNKRYFATKIVKACNEKIISNNNICKIDKIVNKNNNLNFENRNNSNVIKANILDFSFEQNKETIKDNKQKLFFHTDKEQSLGDLNLSFSTDEINTFKYKESTIEDVFNELNNLNSINDSDIKLTFGHENTQNYNYHKNYDVSTTGGRILNDVTFHKYNLMNVK